MVSIGCEITKSKHQHTNETRSLPGMHHNVFNGLEVWYLRKLATMGENKASAAFPPASKSEVPGGNAQNLETYLFIGCLWKSWSSFYTRENSSGNSAGPEFYITSLWWKQNSGKVENQSSRWDTLPERSSLREMRRPERWLIADILLDTW